MDFLKYLGKKPKPKMKLARLPGGTFTVDLQGRLLSSTVPQCYSEALLREIGAQVVALFRGAKEARLRWSELILDYSSIRITAREFKGGAIVFLAPRTLNPTKALP